MRVSTLALSQCEAQLEMIYLILSRGLLNPPRLNARYLRVRQSCGGGLKSDGHTCSCIVSKFVTS